MSMDDVSLYTAEGVLRIAKIARDGQTTFFGNVGGKPNGIRIERRAIASSQTSAVGNAP
jgi:hypothetical protein